MITIKEVILGQFSNKQKSLPIWISLNVYKSSPDLDQDPIFYIISDLDPNPDLGPDPTLKQDEKEYDKFYGTLWYRAEAKFLRLS